MREQAETHREPLDSLVIRLQQHAHVAEQALLSAENKITTATLERDLNRSVLLDAEAALNALKTAVSRARDVLNVTVVQGQGLPHRPSRLLSDVLSEIFLFAATDDDFECELPFERLPPSFSVASVSRHWRDVALATPMLWVRIRLTFSAAADPERLGMFTTRSRSQPLHLRLCAYEGSLGLSSDIFRNKVVMGALHRCRTLHLSCTSATFGAEAFRVLLLAPMPELRLFSVTHRGGGLSTPYVNLDRVDEHCITLSPLLDSIDLGLLPFRSIQPTTMPLIRSATIRSLLTYREILLIARTWADLSYLETNLVCEPTLPIPEFTLASLQTLKCNGKEKSILRLLSHPQTPNLQALSLECTSDSVMQTFRNFLSPGPCQTLRTLTLTGDSVSHLCLALSNLPELTDITFCAARPVGLSDLFKAWPKLSKVALPPRLAALSFLECEFSAHVLTALAYFLQLRLNMAGTEPIRELRIVQTGLVSTAESICPAWLEPRLSQLVEHVVIDTSHVTVGGNTATGVVECGYETRKRGSRRIRRL